MNERAFIFQGVCTGFRLRNYEIYFSTQAMSYVELFSLEEPFLRIHVTTNIANHYSSVR